MSDRDASIERLRPPAEGLGFAEALEHAEIGATVFDARGAVAWCNPRLAQLLGRSRDELTGEELGRFVIPERREAVRRLFEDLASGTAEAFQHDTEIERPDGERRVVRWTATLLRVEGRFAGVACLAEDVTDRRRTAQAHRLARAALDCSGTAVAMADEQGRIVYVNPALLRLWGFTRESDALGRSVGDFWTDASVARAAAAAVARDGHWEGELIARRADGSQATYRVHSNLFEDPETGAVRSIATFEDVSALRATEERLLWAQRLAGFGDWSLGLDSLTLTCSDAACELLGVARERFGGTRDEFLALVHAGDRTRVRAAFKRALTSPERLDLAFRIVRPDGAERVLHADARLIHDAAGRPQHLRGVFQDVTARSLSGDPIP